MSTLRVLGRIFVFYQCSLASTTYSEIYFSIISISTKLLILKNELIQGQGFGRESSLSLLARSLCQTLVLGKGVLKIRGTCTVSFSSGVQSDVNLVFNICHIE